MSANQNQKKLWEYVPATGQQRVAALICFLLVAGLYAFLFLAGSGRIDIEKYIGPCGFYIRYGLPCPTCGITTAAMAFATGRVLEAFYIQPAAGLLCLVLVVAAVLSFIVAVFGIYLEFLRRLFAEVKMRYILLVLLAVLAGGWLVTLARCLAATAG